MICGGDAHQELLGPVVESLVQAALKDRGPRPESRIVLPSRDVVLACLDGIRQIFFPGYFGAADLHDKSVHYYIGATLDRMIHDLEEQIARAVAFTAGHEYASCRHCCQIAQSASNTFIARLPEVRRLIATDVDAAFDGDPALQIKDEAIFSYPGVFAVTEQRIAHELYKLNVPLIPRMITEHAHSLTGIDIHPGARIGERFFIDHGTGVVIGETSRIGKNVRLYQGVTLGAKSFPLDENGKPMKGIDRHPIVEDDVVIYAGATILGRIIIGKGASIGGNVWLTHSVPANSRVTQAEARETKFEDGGGI
jgi:serine O-acetyltransferase